MEPGHMMAEAWHGMAGAMVRWADGASSARLHGPKGGAQGAQGLAKGAGPRGHSASLLCFTNFFKENVNLRIIYDFEK